MVSKNYMDKVLLNYGKLKMVPIQKRHIIPLYSTMSKENLFEAEAVYKIDLMKTLIEQTDIPDVFIVEDEKEPLAIIGIQGISAQQGLMWSMFSKNLKQNWRAFVKASPSLINYLHTHYHEIIVDTWMGNNKMVKWLDWLGFDMLGSYENENGFNIIHFVRCNPERNNVYAFPSRPVIH
jgi:hypothetical protein